MPNLAKVKALLKNAQDISVNVGRNVGNKVNALTDAEIEAAIKARFPNANITSHSVIPPQPASKFGPFEHTSQVSFQANPTSLQEAIGGLSQDLKQQAIPAVNKTTEEAILAGPQAAEWGGQFSKQHFVRPGEETAYGNLQEQFKDKFTPGFYHGSTSPNITAFDPTKAKKDLDLVTPGVTFVSPNPKFADSFLSVQGKPSYNLQTAEIKAPTQYKPGGTIYPVSVNLENHFDPNTPQGLQVVKDYIDNLYDNAVDKAKFLARISDPHSNWQTMESPKFLQHLRDTGHETFAVNEGGVSNIGVLNPANIRGKFADFDPAQAANPDFMKAEGGAVEGYAPGGKVGALSELINLVRNQGGAAAGRRLEKAADLVPNLEHKYQPQALQNVFTGDNASAVMAMKPSEFQNYATPLAQSNKEWHGYRIGDPTSAATPTGSYDDYIKYLSQFAQPGAGGFNSVPYLQLGKEFNVMPVIKGHEGRHRSEALQLLGDDPMLVGMQPRPELREPFPRRSQEEYLKALKEDIANPRTGIIQVSPQKIPDEATRPRLALPDIFKKGGLV